MKLNLVNTLSTIDQADIIIIPCIKGEYKKLEKFLQGVQYETWADAALEMYTHRKPEPKKITEQFIKRTKIILVGLADDQSYVQQSNGIRSALYKSLEKNKKWKVTLVMYEGMNTNSISACTHGLTLANMRIDYYHKERNDNLSHLSVYCSNKNDLATVEQGEDLAEIQESICHLVNLPSNIKNPRYMVDWARNRFANRNIDITVLDHEDIQRKGMGALYNVGKGSVTPPHVLILEYRPKSKQKLKHIGLVGKGVTFDTGGISLKDPLNMHLMKSDMAGAAAVLGAVDAIEKFNLKVQVTAVIPFAENAIGSEAYRPGDVVTAYNGKSIEVIDTDAEGRLILADALAYITHVYKTDHLIDLATLTGSIIMTFGYRTAGLFSNDEALIKLLRKSGDRTGERLWPLPVWDEYLDEMLSDIADLKNLNTKPGAGAITAAKFLQAFTNDHPSWAHLDVAGVTMTDNDFSKQRSATGYGVLLLKDWIESVL